MELSKDYSVVVDEVSGRKIIVVTELWRGCNESLEWYFENNVDGKDESLFAIRERAEIDEVISFANDIRAAGGGSFIDGLMPSIPMEPNSCLIANALNFDCEVNAFNGDWYMEVDDGKIGRKIAEHLALTFYGGEQEDEDEDGYFSPCEILLPPRIGYVAQAFDTYRDYELEEYNAQSIVSQKIDY